MPSPNVGRVEIKVALDDSDLHSETITAIREEIDHLNVGLTDTNKAIKDISSEPLQEILKHTDELAKKNVELHKQARYLREDEEKLDKIRAKSADSLERRTKAAEKVAKIEATIAKYQADGLQALTRHTNALAKAKEELTAADAEYTASMNENASARLSAEDKVWERQQEVALKVTALRTADLEELKRILLAKKREYEKELKDEENDLVASNKKRMDDAEKAAKAEADLAERTAAKRARAEEREEKRRRNRFKNRIDQSAGSVASILNLGRVGPIALASVVVGFEQLIEIAADLTGIIGTLPGVFAEAGAAMATFQVATYGVSDAISALSKGDMDAFAEALAKLSPNAQQTMLAFQALIPALTEVQRAVQDKFFDGFDQQLVDLANTFLPMVSTAMTTLASEMNKVIIGVTDQLMQPEMVNTINDIINNIIAGFQHLEPMIGPLVNAFATIMEVSTSFLPQLGDVFTGLAREFDAFIQEVASNGKLQEWIQDGIDTFLQLIPVIIDLGKLFLTFADGSGGALSKIDSGIRGVTSALEWMDQHKRIVNDMTNAVLLLAEAFVIWKTSAMIGTVIAAIGTGLTWLVGAAGLAAQSLAGVALAFGAAGGSSTAAAVVETAALESVAGVATQVGTTVGTAMAGGAEAGAVGTGVAAGQMAVELEGVALVSAEVGTAVGIAITGGAEAGAVGTGVAAGQMAVELGGVTVAAGTTATALGAGITTGANVGATGVAVAATREIASLTAVEAKAATTAAAVARIGGMGLLAAGAGVTVAAAAGVGTLVWAGDQAKQQAIKDGKTELAPIGPRGMMVPVKPSGGDSGGGGGGGVPNTSNAKQAPGQDGISQRQLDATIGSITKPLRDGTFQLPDGGYAVPAPPAKGADGGKITDKDILDSVKKANADMASNFDPFADIGGAQNQPGYPGKPPLSVTVDNLPPAGMGSGPALSAGALGTIPLPAPVPFSQLPMVDGSHQQVTAMLRVAQSLGLSTHGPGDDFFGNFSHDNDGLNHPKGIAGDFATHGVGVPDDAKLAFANFMAQNFGDLLNELIYGDPRFQGPFQYSQDLLNQHMNHVHASVSDANAPIFEARLNQILGQVNGTPGMPAQPFNTGLDQKPGTVNGVPVMDPADGQMKYQVVDQARVMSAYDDLISIGHEVDGLNAQIRDYKGAIEQGADYQEELNKTQQKLDDILRPTGELAQKQLAYQKAKQGDYKDVPGSKAKAMDYSKLPKGDPRRVLAGALKGAGGDDEDISMIVGNVLGAAGAPIGAAAGQAVADAATAFKLNPTAGVPTAPSTNLNTLVQQGNPLALAQASGFDVPDYTRAGSGPSGAPANITVNGGPPTDAQGRMYSDTAALIDRTFTNLDAAEKARHDQVMTVLNEVKDRLASDALAPTIEAGATGAFQGAGQELGTAIGESSAPIIAAAVASAVPSGGTGGDGAAVVNNAVAGVTNAATAAIPNNATGGPIVGPGTGTSDSILSWLSNGEYVLSAKHVQALGGFGGVNKMLGNLPKFATGGGVDVSSTLGADFFGVSQIPIIGAIINTLIAVLLKVIGVNIEARDTLDEMSKDFREYRGDFKAFDASGRLMNDTSGLIDRTGSSTQAAADERIRILKLVLDALIKYIIEKLIVPIGKAVANAVIQAGAGAAGGAVAAAPGGSFASGAVSGVISSAGGATVDIIADVGATLAESLISVGLDAIGNMFKTSGLSGLLFGGGTAASIFDPISSVINGVLGGITSMFGGLFGGLATVIPGMKFDQGGIATGTGLMPKATLSPERVLSPRQTMLFESLVAKLESGSSPSTSTTTIHAPFTVVGGERGAKETRDRLLALMS